MVSIKDFINEQTTLDEDCMRNKKPIKKYQNGKIDGVITMLMSHKLFAEAWQNPL